MDDETAAGFAIAYGTAYGALCWAARLQAGETLVVHGAAAASASPRSNAAGRSARA